MDLASLCILSSKKKVLTSALHAQIEEKSEGEIQHIPVCRQGPGDGRVGFASRDLEVLIWC